MKKFILAVLVLNSVTIFAVELGEKDESICTSGNQSARSIDEKKEDKKLDQKVEIETKAR